MPKFVWEMTSRGAWAPQLFHGELPREMTQPHNAERYRIHDVSAADIENVGKYVGLTGRRSVLSFLAEAFPAPTIETEENENDL